MGPAYAFEHQESTMERESPITLVMGHLICWVLIGLLLTGSVPIPRNTRETIPNAVLAKDFFPVKDLQFAPLSLSLGWGLEPDPAVPAMAREMIPSVQSDAYRPEMLREGMSATPPVNGIVRKRTTASWDWDISGTSPQNQFSHEMDENHSKPRGKEPEELFHGIIVEAAEKHNLDPDLVKAIVMAESGYNPKAVSKKGAKGLMQLMPSTAEALGIRDILDPRQNVDGGVRYFKKLLTRFKGDVKLALAAYNAGSRKVIRSKGIPPIRATRYYIRKVLKFHHHYKARAEGKMQDS